MHAIYLCRLPSVMQEAWLFQPHVCELQAFERRHKQGWWPRRQKLGYFDLGMHKEARVPMKGVEEGLPKDDSQPPIHLAAHK